MKNGKVSQSYGQHTMGFWGAFILSIITLGIYSIVWFYEWLNREANFLERNGKTKILSSGTYLIIQIITAPLK